MPEQFPNHQPPIDSVYPHDGQMISPSNQFGLRDGEFTVRRTNGQEETGWSITRIVEHRDNEGNAAQYAVINKTENGADGTQILEKSVPVDTLRSWQTEPDSDETRDISELRESNEALRLKDVFVPIVRPEVTAKDPGYAHLISDDPGAKERASAYFAEVDKVQPLQREYDKYVSDESRRISADYLTRSLEKDKKLTELIGSFKETVDLSDPLNVVDAIRSNPDVRLEVGKYLLDKVNQVAKMHPEVMPSRVAQNTQKNPKGLIANYVKVSISSREYVALLCLAKLDGSFDNLMADRVEYGPNNEVELGQHRVAADMVLNEPIVA